MKESHKKHYVSAKIALYSNDKQKVVVTHILIGQSGEGYGIPGGHIEVDETPEDALRRELEEELGIQVADFTIKKAFLHRNGKIIIGYTGIVSGDTTFVSPDEMIERGEWKTREQIEFIELGSYKDFVIDNWPS